VAPAADKRKNSRYLISPTFPVKSVLSLVDKSVSVSGGSSAHGKISLKAHNIPWKDYPGTLVDLSTTGANIHVNLAAVAFAEDPCRMKFSLGSYRLEIPGTVAHFVCYAHYAVCGVQFNFPSAVSEKAYLQVLEPVIIGTSLTPVPVEPDSSGHPMEQYLGKYSSLLTIWRVQPGGDIFSFDFRLNRYGVRWGAGMTELSTYQIEPEGAQAAKAAAKPTLKLKLKTTDQPDAGRHPPGLTEAQDEEVRWLFCLAVYNLSPSVAEDVRKFLLSLVVA
jgi:hypothetical protein